ncbi:Four and a half LIM domains protein 2 [Frankliniella fusca]|uniref:Four and a half LIM domains protein 2 n=1 Tax=Frankliniella fusca TaxID=407009 RepID=A0AAE1H1I6_9NEOP|nr:Four and a half LIM domains protein 2 [Frankliniella fusca]
MGLLLSVLIVCVGVFEALDCYYHFRAGLLPPARAGAHGSASPASGWRQHLTNLNERWRRRPSALTCGGGGGGGGAPELSAAPLDAFSKNAAAPLQEGRRPPSPSRPSGQLNGSGPPPRWLNNHAEEDTLGNGRGEASPTEESARPPEIDGEAAASIDAGDDSARARPAIRTGDPSSKRRLSSSLDRPVTISSDGGALLDPEHDVPRRLSESFPEIENLPPPKQELLKVEVDLPRRLSEIAADDSPRRISESYHSGSEPSSPTRKGSNVDISWPTFTPVHVHPAHKPTLYRLEDVMSVDVEDDVFLPNPPNNPPGGTIIPVHHNLLEESQMAPKIAVAREDLNLQKLGQSEELAANSDEYKQLTNFLKFLDDHIQEDDCMNLWQSIQGSDCRQPQTDKRDPPSIENPSRQYLELQEFLKRNYSSGEAPGPGLAQDEGPQQQQPLDESEAVDIQKLVAPVLNSAPTDREYMDLLNFWFLLRAQEESPDEPLLEEYFQLKRQDEFKAALEPSAALGPPENKFQAYEELQRFLASLPPPTGGPAPPPVPDVTAIGVAAPTPASDRPAESGAAACAGLLRPPGEDDDPSSECADLPPKSPLRTELVTVSEEPHHLQRPARSHSFEAAPLGDLSENLIKAALEASALAGRGDEAGEEDAEVAAITGRAEHGAEEAATAGEQAAGASNGGVSADRPRPAAVEAKTEATADSARPGPGQSLAQQPAPAPAPSSSQSEKQSEPEAFWPPSTLRSRPHTLLCYLFLLAMADVEVQMQFTTTEKKTRRVKKTSSKRRESSDGPVTETEVVNDNYNNDQGGEYTKAMNKDWHGTHFCCWQCDESLTGQRYVLRDEHPYCIKCYESVFANTCEECSKTIGIDSKDLSYKDKHWHEACFLCSKCRVSLVDKQFGSKADHIYCGNCYDAQFASRCDGCGEIFRAVSTPSFTNACHKFTTPKFQIHQSKTYDIPRRLQAAFRQVFGIGSRSIKGSISLARYGVRHSAVTEHW